MTLGWCRAIFRALLRFSPILGLDEARRAEWRKILAELAPFPTTMSHGQMVFDEAENSDDFGGNSRYPVVNFGPIHPAAIISRRGSTVQQLAAGRATVEQINALNRWVPENGLCMGWPPASMLTNNASRTTASMQDALERVMSANFVPQIHGGCLSEQAGATQAINDLLLASYDGVIELYPAGWVGSDNASFTTLRARGAFLVSARWDGALGGVADGVVVYSEVGGVCSLVNPFGSAALEVVEVHGGAGVQVSTSLDVRSFTTERQTSYRISRAKKTKRAKAVGSTV